MTTLSEAQSAGQAASYHSSDNYHTKDGITEVGHWKGQGAELLGLEGEIDQKQYVEVLNGYAPGSLTADQVKTLEKIDKEGENLRKEADKLKEDISQEGYAEKKEQLDAQIKAYNEKRDDFHKDVASGGLHTQIKEIKKFIADNKDKIITDKDLYKTGSGDLIDHIQTRRDELVQSIYAGNSEAKNDLAAINQLEDKINSGRAIGDGDIARSGIKYSPENAAYKEAKTASGKTFKAFDFKEMGKAKYSQEKLEQSEKISAYVDESKRLQNEYRAMAKEDKQLIRDGHDKESGIAMHRAGWDMTFSASKSVSIMALEAGDNKLIDLHKAASDTTYALAEKYLAQCLEYDDKRRVAANTGNMIAAEYVHYTSRATEKDSTPDPQLHSHMFTMNLTQNEEGKWRSLEVDKIFKNQMHLGQIYQNELAYQMRQETDYGLTWKNSGDNMAVELKGVDQDLIALRSGRTKQIEALTAAKEKALGRPLTGEEKDDITKNSRVSKGEQNVDELRSYWKDTREELGHSTESLQAATANQVHDKTIASSAEDAIKIAVTTLSDRQATFSELELLAEASRASQGIASIQDLQVALKENTRSGAKGLTNQTDTFVLGVENGQNIYASAKMLVAEANIEKAVKDGKGAGALMSKEEFDEAFKKVEENKKAEAGEGGKEYFTLTEGQGSILTHIATSKDRYIGVMGDAGVGKTTSLERLTQTVEVLKETLGDKFEIQGLAPTHLAAATIERDAGIVSRTVDSFINKPTEPTTDKKQVYLVDESSMLDTVKMAKLVEIAEKNDAKVVFIGDNKQHKPVGAGSQFDRMLKTGQMEFAYATESMRHQTEMTKEVAESFKKIDTLHKGLDALDAKGKLIQNENKEELVKSLVSNLASDYTDAHKASLLPRDERPVDLRAGLDDVLAIVGTNAERQMINTALRPLLQEAGVIGKEDHKINTLEDKRLDNTAAQFSGNYAVGDTLIHHKGDGQIKQGVKNKVIAVNRESNELKLGWHTKGGQYREKWISGNQATEFSAYKDVEKSFSVGDKIAFEGNDKKIGVKNNETARITEIREDGKWLVDKNGKEIEIDPKSFPFIAHGWTMTSHKSQGQGIGRTHALADTESGMINRESGYVVMTRAKHDITVYTDNRQKLEAKYKKEQLKLNAGDKIDVKQFAGIELEDGQEKVSIDRDMDNAQTTDTLDCPDFDRESGGEGVKENIDPSLGFEADNKRDPRSAHHAHISELAFGGSKGMKYDDAAKDLGYNRQDMARWKMSRNQMAENKLNKYAEKLIERRSVDPRRELLTAVGIRIDEAKREAEKHGKPLSQERVTKLKETYTKQLTPGMQLKEEFMGKMVASGLAARDGDAYKLATNSISEKQIGNIAHETVVEKYGHTDNRSITIQTKHAIASKHADRTGKDYFEAKEKGDATTPELYTAKIQNDLTKASTSLDMITNNLLENKSIDIAAAKQSIAESVKEFALNSGKSEEIAEMMANSAVNKYEKLQQSFIEDLHDKGMLKKEGESYSIAEGKHEALASYRATAEHKQTMETLSLGAIGYRDDRSTSTDNTAKLHKRLANAEQKPDYAAKHEIRLQRAEEDLLSNKTVSLDERRAWVNSNIDAGELRDNMLEDIDRLGAHLDKQVANGYAQVDMYGDYSIVAGKHKEFAQHRSSEEGQKERDLTVSQKRIIEEKLINGSKTSIKSAQSNIDRIRHTMNVEGSFFGHEALGPQNEVRYQSFVKLENQIMVGKGVDLNLPPDYKFESPEHAAAHKAHVERAQSRIADLVRDGILLKDTHVQNKWNLNVEREDYDKYLRRDSTIDARAMLAKTEWNRSMRGLDRKDEVGLMLEARNEQLHTGAIIKKMGTLSQEHYEKADEHWKQSKSISISNKTRFNHIQDAAREGMIAKDLAGGKRFQQLNRVEAKIMEKGEIDLRAERNFVLKQPGGTKEMRAGYLAGQARSQTMLNQMVEDGILVRDPKNNERYELAVSRQEYAAYRKSEGAHQLKSELARDAWNKALGDKLFEKARANADATMIAGGGWNPREAIAKVKGAGLYNKDTEEIYERLNARYERLREEGLVRKIGGEYRAAVSQYELKSFVGSREDRLMAFRGEGENAQQYRDMKKTREATKGVIIPGGVKTIDNAIMRSTHVNLEVAGRDIEHAYKGAAYMLRGSGFMGIAAAGVIGVIAGTAKTLGRGLAGAVYRTTKSVVKDTTKAIKETLDIRMDKEVDTEKAVDVMTKDERFEQFEEKLRAAAGRDKDGERPELIKEDDKKIDPNTGLEKVDLEQVNKEIEELTGKDKEDPTKEAKAEDEKEPAKSFEERLEEAAGGRKLDDIEEKENQEKAETAERNEEEERNNAVDEREIEKEDERDDR